MQTTIIGIDCATQPNRVGLALGTSTGESLTLERVCVGSKKQSPLQITSSWSKGSSGAVLLALDAPLGWPQPLANELPGHQAGAEVNRGPDVLFRRTTDCFIRKRLELRPFEVGADKIARTAHTALKLLGCLRRELGVEIPLAGGSATCETGGLDLGAESRTGRPRWAEMMGLRLYLVPCSTYVEPCGDSQPRGCSPCLSAAPAPAARTPSRCASAAGGPRRPARPPAFRSASSGSTPP